LTPSRNFWRCSARSGFDDFAAAEDDVLAVVVDLDDLEFVDLADVFVEILRRDDVDLRAGQEGFDADVDHEAAFDDSLDLAARRDRLRGRPWRSFPSSVCGRPSPWRGRPCLRRFQALEEHFDFVADLDVFVFELVRKG